MGRPLYTNLENHYHIGQMLVINILKDILLSSKSIGKDWSPPLRARGLPKVGTSLSKAIWKIPNRKESRKTICPYFLIDRGSKAQRIWLLYQVQKQKWRTGFKGTWVTLKWLEHPNLTQHYLTCISRMPNSCVLAPYIYRDNGNSFPSIKTS